MTKTAVIYARYSSDSQSEQSIEGQLRVCNEYAKNNDILILNTYIDRAMTGTNDNRPNFQQMLKDSSKKKWNYVLIYKFDRFSRNKYETAIHKKTLKDNGVKIISATEYVPDTPEGIILESMLEGYAEYYSAELSQKVKRGMRETRLKGNFTGGTLPYGYKLDGRKIVIDDSTVETVRYIFEQYSKGVVVRNIIAQLNEKGILNKNKPFSKNAVYRILSNEKYSGTYIKDNEIIDNMYPRIISKEIFDKVREKVNKNKYGKQSVKTVYLLRNKVKCGYCGKPISAETGTARNGEVKRYYKCIGKKVYHTNCEKTPVPKTYLEALISNVIIEQMSSQDNLDIIVAELMKRQQKNENTNLKMLLNEKSRVETCLNNLITAIENGIVSKTTTKRLHELEQQQENLEKQILIEEHNNSMKLTEKDILQYYRQALSLEMPMLINFLVKEIVLYNDKIAIYFYTPSNTSPDDNRGFLLCEIKENLYCKLQNDSSFKYITIKVKLYIV